jgi:hypothetical protein
MGEKWEKRKVFAGWAIVLFICAIFASYSAGDQFTKHQVPQRQAYGVLTEKPVWYPDSYGEPYLANARLEDGTTMPLHASPTATVGDRATYWVRTDTGENLQSRIIWEMGPLGIWAYFDIAAGIGFFASLVAFLVCEGLAERPRPIEQKIQDRMPRRSATSS